MAAPDLIGVGFNFPLTYNVRGQVGLIGGLQDSVNIVRESIKRIVMTPRGSRPMLTNFGCRIHELVFATLDDGTFALVRYHVIEAITEFEERATIDRIRVSSNQEESRLLIDLDFTVIQTNDSGNLVFPAYISSGGRVIA